MVYLLNHELHVSKRERRIFEAANDVVSFLKSSNLLERKCFHQSRLMQRHATHFETLELPLPSDNHG